MEQSEDKGSRVSWLKPVVLIAFLAVVGIAYTQFREQLSLENIAAQESSLREFQQDHPVLVYGLAFALYVAVTGLALPLTAAMSLVYAWFFGFFPALILISFASTMGATIAFLLSRYLFRDLIQQRFGERLTDFNNALERDGGFYLFTLRLIPAIPFFVINVVMGLTPIRVSTYWWVSQLGMLPGTAVFAYAGQSFPDLNTLAQEGAKGILSTELLVAFALLGLFPLAVKKIMQYFVSKRRPQGGASASGGPPLFDPESEDS